MIDKGNDYVGFRWRSKPRKQAVLSATFSIEVSVQVGLCHQGRIAISEMARLIGCVSH